MEEKTWWVIVGGARRIGLALARSLAEDHKLVLTSSNIPQAEEEFSKLSIRTDVRLLHWDANDPQLATRIMTDIGELRGDGITIDGAILVAGTFPKAPFGSWNVEDLHQTWKVNLTFPLLAIQAIAPCLAVGSCIQVILDSSIHRPMLARLPYSCAKSGLACLVKGLAHVFAPDIRIVGHAIGTIMPDAESDPDFLRDQTLLKRLGTPEDLCKAIKYAASSPYLTGQILTLDGGSRWP
ncbi:MAG: SDR family oxidoreductase [Holophagaceae bacterium]|nr:SDR family oxidoreductase [Holophagaceae bacterium]